MKFVIKKNSRKNLRSNFIADATTTTTMARQEQQQQWQQQHNEIITT